MDDNKLNVKEHVRHSFGFHTVTTEQDAMNQYRFANLLIKLQKRCPWY